MLLRWVWCWLWVRGRALKGWGSVSAQATWRIASLATAFSTRRVRPRAPWASYRPGGIEGNATGFQLTLCYDKESLEFVAASHPECFWGLTYNAFLNAYEDRGFVFFWGGTAIGRIPPDLAFPLATLYFRIKAQAPGDSELRFCDFVVVRRGLSCAMNSLGFSAPFIARFARSSLHRPGVVRVLPGEPTHPDPPQLPPAAKVYPERPDPDSLEIRFELDAPPVTRPGARDVPVGVYVTSSHEFSGFMTSVRFSPKELQLTRVEEHIRPGLIKADNEKGGCGIVSIHSWTRAGGEGERVRIATLFFDVASELEGVSEVRVELADFENFQNLVAIQYRGGTTAAETVPVALEAAAMALKPAALALQMRPTRRGDANLDYEVNLSDAVAILATLFQGVDAILCPGASDANGDGAVNLSDAIWILNGLFRGGELREDETVYCD